MELVKVVAGYRTFIEKALPVKGRNLVKDYQAIVEWLDKNSDDTSEGQLLRQLLVADARYKTIDKAIKSRKKFRDFVSIGEWNGKTIKEGCHLIETMEASSKVGDGDAFLIQRERFFKLLNASGDLKAVQLYLVQRLMQYDKEVAEAMYTLSRSADEAIKCSTNEEIEAVLRRYSEKASREVKSEAVKKGTQMTSDEVQHFVQQAYYAETPEEIELLSEELDRNFYDSGEKIDYYRNVRNYLKHCKEKLSNEEANPLPPSVPTEKELDGMMEELFPVETIENE